MKISTAPAAARLPWLTLALEAAGGTFTWALDDPPGSGPHLHLWAPGEADWLWRIIGEQAHAATLRDLTSRHDIDVPVSAPAELALLYRLAWGHWLRRWWPASAADGIDPLPALVLDAEVAALTADCEMYFGDTGFDGDPNAVLGAYDDADIAALALHPRPDVRDLHARLREFDTGEQEPVPAASGDPGDYALAAGPGTATESGGGIARGLASVPWESVPAHTFDAAENTIAWSVDAAPDVVADVTVALLPGRTAAPVRVALSLHDPAFEAQATLAPDGRLPIPLPLTATEAWGADWSALVVTVGGVDARDSREQREQVRALVRERIEGGTGLTGLFVAEQIVADNAY
ncbi:hypothetical protein GII30_16465 [Gordonia amarae]|uniref:Uncharacterized protein n=2 Tax=Gordonia amarae TaxID=36821 RepID=G7GV59_9ACTN|nr:hypothetical protein [Gordonia amarae]MCS3880006.1 hypothetical protein [Gordonia amarae]QHN18391.1 hypothetical protein GII35_16780 [Gordonia amarae]QHN22873.1 hypothetical protein GII34_16320 [Gordonia amarae]QHN31776.1 hypothetical protein GII32_16630 [Gordonia amarae]QHN40522.1 hypothetical protein GII30_16465 [Gordonia amarae]